MQAIHKPLSISLAIPLTGFDQNSEGIAVDQKKKVGEREREQQEREIYKTFLLLKFVPCVLKLALRCNICYVCMYAVSWGW